MSDAWGEDRYKLHRPMHLHGLLKMLNYCLNPFMPSTRDLLLIRLCIFGLVESHDNWLWLPPCSDLSRHLGCCANSLSR